MWLVVLWYRLRENTTCSSQSLCLFANWYDKPNSAVGSVGHVLSTPLMQLYLRTTGTNNTSVSCVSVHVPPYTVVQMYLLMNGNHIQVSFKAHHCQKRTAKRQMTTTHRTGQNKKLAKFNFSKKNPPKQPSVSLRQLFLRNPLNHPRPKLFGSRERTTRTNQPFPK